MEQKYVVINFENGTYAKILFTKKGDLWICAMADETMNDLQDLTAGKELKERVKPYIDGKGLWD